MIPPSGGGIASPRGEKAYYIILPHRVDSPPQGGDPPQGEKEYYTILPHSGDYPPQGGNSPPQGEKVYHVVATDKITVWDTLAKCKEKHNVNKFDIASTLQV